MVLESSANNLICEYLGKGVAQLLKWTSNERTQCPIIPLLALLASVVIGDKFAVVTNMVTVVKGTCTADIGCSCMYTVQFAKCHGNVMKLIHK